MEKCRIILTLTNPIKISFSHMFMYLNVFYWNDHRMLCYGECLWKQLSQHVLNSTFKSNSTWNYSCYCIAHLMPKAFGSNWKLCSNSLTELACLVIINCLFIHSEANSKFTEVLFSAKDWSTFGAVVNIFGSEMSLWDWQCGSLT